MAIILSWGLNKLTHTKGLIEADAANLLKVLEGKDSAI